MRLAGAVLGEALSAGAAGEPSEQDVLIGLRTVLSRVAELREVALAAIGMDLSATDYGHAWNATTTAVLHWVGTEQLWRQIRPGNPVLSAEDFARVITAVGPMATDRNDLGPVPPDVGLARKLGILEAAAVVHGLPNFFDYFQPDRDGLVRQLLHAVVDQAEAWLLRISAVHDAAWALRGFVERCYRASAYLLREVFKACASEDVARLHELPELERSLRAIAYERTGMPFQHILERHAAAALRAADVADLVLASGDRRATQARAA